VFDNVTTLDINRIGAGKVKVSTEESSGVKASLTQCSKNQAVRKTTSVFSLSPPWERAGVRGRNKYELNARGVRSQILARPVLSKSGNK
jgi:hypothetical protein